jgi:predicted transcriptional regulator of viral defense system
LLVLHAANVPPEERTWIGSVPVTTVARTLRDAVDANIDPDLIAQIIEEGKARKLLVRADLRGIVAPGQRARRPGRDAT